MPQNDTLDKIRQALQTDRLMDTAVKLVEVPSPTCSATEVADRFAEILAAEGLAVERPECGWAKAPAVVTRWSSGRSGRTAQFNGHLDTVHLPFVPPRIENGIFYGTGVSDMKGGLAAALEALRILRDTDLLPGGDILLTAHELHEGPWGDGSQVTKLIEEGFVGDAVLLPEYLSDQLPLVGRGMAIYTIKITRDGEPVHEVLGGIEQPNVVHAGTDIVQRFRAIDARLQKEKTHPLAGRASMFVGMARGGEIYNQSPTLYEIHGTRRWLAGTDIDAVRAEFDAVLADVAKETGTTIESDYQLCRDGYEIDADSPFVGAFNGACEAIMGQALPAGAKPFVDDGHAFASLGGIPAITHGPNAFGAHTVNEEVAVSELERVALVYALTAIGFCAG